MGEGMSYESKPFFKSVGGKRWLAPRILNLIPHQSTIRYHEPFVGGGAVFFALANRAYCTGEHLDASLNDANGELINAYRCIRDDLETVSQCLHAITGGAITTEAQYLAIRDGELCPAFDPTVARTARFMALNKSAYGGMWRLNASGQMNVPWKKSPTAANAFDAQHLRHMSTMLQRYAPRISDMRDFDWMWSVESAKVQNGDIIYLDPPYPRRPDTTKHVFTNYTEKGFSFTNFETVVHAARTWHRRGVTVFLSGPAYPETLDLVISYGATEASRITRSQKIRNRKGEGGDGTEMLAVWK
jgi:DNA adenine methylase